jgi:hypothetical protein
MLFICGSLLSSFFPAWADQAPSFNRYRIYQNPWPGSFDEVPPPNNIPGGGVWLPPMLPPPQPIIPAFDPDQNPCLCLAPKVLDQLSNPRVSGPLADIFPEECDWVVEQLENEYVVKVIEVCSAQFADEEW